MRKHFFYLLLVFAIFSSSPLFACEENAACDKCARESEYSWNPSNQFITTRLSRFYSLDEEIVEAYKANDFDKVKELAKENLELAAIYRCNWNYGNAIHDTNRVLGLISLNSGDIDAAQAYLLKAGKSTASPQLATFGPDLDLANELLHLGKTDAVQSYLKDIKLFWEMNNGIIDIWLAKIEQGEKPQLDRFAGSKQAPFLIVIFWLTTAWPFIVSTAFLHTYRKQIPKKLLFFVTTVASGYAAMYAGNFIIGYKLQEIMNNMENLTDAMIFVIGYLPLVGAVLLPVLMNFLFTRFFRSGTGK